MTTCSVLMQRCDQCDPGSMRTQQTIQLNHWKAENPPRFSTERPQARLCWSCKYPSVCVCAYLKRLWVGFPSEHLCATTQWGKRADSGGKLTKWERRRWRGMTEWMQACGCNSSWEGKRLQRSGTLFLHGTNYRNMQEWCLLTSHRSRFHTGKMSLLKNWREEFEMVSNLEVVAFLSNLVTINLFENIMRCLFLKLHVPKK